MSSDDTANENTANDTMHHYETDQDSGDVTNDANTNADTDTGADPQPAISPAPDHLGNDDSDNPAPIPMATPQSPVQTESDVAQTENSPEVASNTTTEARNNDSGNKEYREV